MNIDSNKQIAQNTSMLYLRNIMVMFVSLYTSRVVLKLLGVQDFGIYNVVGGVVTMFSFLNGALGAANSRFFAFQIGKKNNTQLKKVYTTAFTIQLLMAIVVFILLETIGLWLLNSKLTIPSDRLNAANWVYQFAVLSSVIAILQVPLTASIIAHENMTVYAYIGIFDVVMKLTVALLLFLSEYDKLISYGVLIFIVQFLLYLVYNLYCKSQFVEYSLRVVYERSRFKEMLSYSGWSFIGSFANIMKLQGNNVLLNVFFGPAANAARGVAYQVNIAISSFSQNFTTALNPQIIKNYASNDYQEMINLLLRGAKMSYFLLLILSVPILLQTEFILNLWLIDVPEYTVIFTQLVLINSLVESFTYVMGAAIQATGRIKWYQIGVSGVLLLNLPISYLFFKFGFEPQIVFYVSITLAFFALFIRMVIMKKNVPLFNIGVFILNVFLNSIIVTCFAVILPFSLKGILQAGWIQFVLVTVAAVLSTIGSIFLFGLNRSERRILKKMFDTLLRKLN